MTDDLVSYGDFAELAKPGNAGQAFAITREAFKDKFGSKVENFPPLDCEHAIFHDEITDNYLVERPGPDGYWCLKHGDHLTVVRKTDAK